MPRLHTYYLGRVIKIGNLDSDKIYEAIKSPKAFYWYGSGWSFFDAEVKERSGISYIAGRLSKFDPKAEVVISDPQAQKESIQPEPNMRVASSHFVYIPSVSGIAFSKASPHIEEYSFPHRFSSVIKHTHEDFFVDCDIKLIADLKTFAEKLMTLEGIYRISANLNPPNPIFHPLWKPLKDYMKQRRSDKMLIREEAQGGDPLHTDLPKIVDAMSKQTKDNKFEYEGELPVGDAAILMAADGYGSGHVKGSQNGEKVIIKTSETNRHFAFDEEPSNDALFEEAYMILKDIEDERHLEH
tara:strand:- start:415 stop:1308 length:894 start_codon:yes stop_codon:yes gene_type:complete